MQETIETSDRKQQLFIWVSRGQIPAVARIMTDHNCSPAARIISLSLQIHWYWYWYCMYNFFLNGLYVYTYTFYYIFFFLRFYRRFFRFRWPLPCAGRCWTSLASKPMSCKKFGMSWTMATVVLPSRRWFVLRKEAKSSPIESNW